MEMVVKAGRRRHLVRGLLCLPAKAASAADSDSGCDPVSAIRLLGMRHEEKRGQCAT